MKVRTRFAPSPTGDLHIGGARTALFNYLFARHHQGEFVLRIEDTDRERSTEASAQVILDAMAWLQLGYDEGPIYQFDRLARYQAVLEKLENEGLAYRCYCTKERLESMREAQLANKEKPRYDGHCRDLKEHPDTSFVWRLKTPQTGTVSFDDLIFGTIEVQNSELDDLVLARQGGIPTYNFAVVIDDWDMEITHVIRGDDHLSNTPRQIHIYNALKAPVPQFAHVPMILGSDGKRLSKRHGALNVLEYRELGILPQALLNYLVRLGWSHGDQEIFSPEELIRFFNLDAINRSAAAFDMDKLLWVNQQYFKTMEPSELAVLLKPFLEKAGLDLNKGPALESIVIALRDRVKTLSEMAQKSEVWFHEEVNYQEEAINTHLSGKADEVLAFAETTFAEIENWQPEAIKHALVDICDSLNLKMGKVGPTIRVATTGSTESPSLDVTLWLLGKQKTLERIEQAKDLYFP